MVMKSHYIVQGFNKGKGGRLDAEPPFLANNIAHAQRVAERLANERAAVIAFVNTGDVDTGDYDEPKLIFAHGDDLPPEVYEMEKITQQ